MKIYYNHDKVDLAENMALINLGHELEPFAVTLVNPTEGVAQIWHSLGLQKDRVDEISQYASEKFETLVTVWEEKNGGKINYTQALVECTALCRTPNELAFICYLVTRTVADFEVDLMVSKMDKKQRKLARKIITPDGGLVKATMFNVKK